MSLPDKLNWEETVLLSTTEQGQDHRSRIFKNVVHHISSELLNLVRRLHIVAMLDEVSLVKFGYLYFKEMF